MANDQLQFVAFTGPGKHDDPEVRTLIRKQAMHKVGLARRQRGNYGLVNRGQLPRFDVAPMEIPQQTTVGSVEVSSSESSCPSTSETTVSGRSTRANAQHTARFIYTTATSANEITTVMENAGSGSSSAPRVALSSDYEAARAKFQVDITDLSMLTSFHIAKAAMSILSANPHHVVSLMGHRQWSYVQYVPSCYGSSVCLTAATDCLLLRVQSVIMPHKQNRAREMLSHAKALQTLQCALTDPVTSMQPDVLCASQILGLRELLDPTRESAWSKHIDGSAHLIKHRTATRFTSDFEKSLFAAHLGPIVFEALIENRHCYLEDPEWLGLFQSLAEEGSNLTDKSPLAIKLRSHMFTLPGLWCDIDAAMRGRDLFDDDVLVALEVRCRAAWGKLSECLSDYKTHCIKQSLEKPTREEINKRREIYGMVLECLAVAVRLLSTVCEKDRLNLEVRAQAFASRILDLQAHPSNPRHAWLFTGHEVGVAQSIASTKGSWTERSPDAEEERRLAARTRYIAWNDLVRNNRSEA